MPSPIGHILAGGAVYLGATRQEDQSKAILGFVLLGSILPDFDFLPGLLVGNPGLYHHGISHSIGFASLYGVLVFGTFYWVHRGIAKRAAVLAILAYGSHLVLDALGASEGARGIPILWPLSSERFGFDSRFFGHFHHGGLNQGIWSVLRWDNLPAVARELAILGPPVLLLWLRREWRAKTVRRSKLDARPSRISSHRRGTEYAE
jgi:hypothetical protein